MNATVAKKLRFGDVAYAIGATPKSLRLWLQRGLVDIHTPKPEGGWAEYSFYDIAVLALVRKFVDFGINVETASGLANKVMTAFFPRLLHLRHPEKMPAGALAAMWANQRLLVYPSEDGEHWHLKHYPLWEKAPEPATAYLTIDVEAVWREAFERAVESANEGADDE